MTIQHPLAIAGCLLALSLMACNAPGTTPTPSANASPSPAVSASPAEASGPDVEACEHTQSGPASSVTATTTTTDAPKVSNDHRRYDVTLAAQGLQRGGYVRYESAEAADHVFFINKSVPVKLKDATGNVVPFEASANSSTVCGEIKGRFTGHLEVGVYYLEFGPTDEQQVAVVVEEAEHEGAVHQD